MKFNSETRRRASLTKRTALLLIMTFVIGTTANVQARKLLPVDDAAKDPAFFTFRARLIQAVQRRDANYLISILSPSILNSFGGNGGIEEFKKDWKLDRPQSPVWLELAKVLSLGGAFAQDGSFSAPYLHSSWPENGGDIFEVGAIVGDNVRVRAAPQITSSIVQTLSFDIIDVTEWQTAKARGEKRPWVKVKLANGQTGYVAEEFIRSPIDYRAVFAKEGGRWLMTAFVAGD